MLYKSEQVLKKNADFGVLFVNNFFFTFLSGLTQNFEQLLVVRGLQGLGFDPHRDYSGCLM